MQRLTIVRYTTKPETAKENVRLSQQVFADVQRDTPDDIAYAVFRDGEEFIHVFMNFTEDNSDAVTEIPSFHAFSADLPARCLIPPQPERHSVELVGRYGFASG